MSGVETPRPRRRRAVAGDGRLAVASAVPEAGVPDIPAWTLARAPTINDVARLAKVSKKTVSRVINQSPHVHDATRAVVDAVVARIGYVPSPQARGLAINRSFLLGLIYDNPNAQYIVNVQGGILEACHREGFELVVHPCRQVAPGFLAEVKTFVQRQNLDGVILVPPLSEDAALVALLRAIGCRYMRLMSVPLDEPEAMVLHTDRTGAAEVGAHLAQLGHTKVALITGPQGYRSTHERREGFLGALAQHGVTVPDPWIVEGLYTFETGEARGVELLAGPNRPTAIFASNDEMAAGVYKAAYRLGISIPRELTVVGFDDTPLASRMCPALSTVRLPIHDMGRLAAERLIGRINAAGEGGAKAKLAQPLTVTPRLVVRESSASPI
ncbi:LacI family DNA-binding transcriptional regulator [Nitrospirillum sp. BR 11828]|uniref:LacI family DNA-binding transcriptional regulator n=1 Tax=Nitrospirillum sp. BR 11828 TaxID=3104325 RepID=UPI002ACA9264|nr:LacI family DNA-binding transcriptional regulator [Nitrospirillum sp. BR 11828]MDZ5647108.1 LacI family DNA-binding transcriptional regulator [Nitrospirillum sp. BR 11828]